LWVLRRRRKSHPHDPFHFVPQQLKHETQNQKKTASLPVHVQKILNPQHRSLLQNKGLGVGTHLRSYSVVDSWKVFWNLAKRVAEGHELRGLLSCGSPWCLWTRIGTYCDVGEFLPNHTFGDSKRHKTLRSGGIFLSSWSSVGGPSSKNSSYAKPVAPLYTFRPGLGNVIPSVRP
jgi:hypothetical protein